MEAPILAGLGVLVMVAALFLIPLGMPGTWVMMAVLLAGLLFGTVSGAVFALLLTLATGAELVEFLLVRRMNLRYGGSNRAFWGALAGGLIGVLVGAPVPLIGPVVAGLAGSFVGAALVTLAETRQLTSAGRVGWGVVLGRILSAVVKTGAGIVILVLGAGALILR